jgi:ribosome-associated protein
VKKPAPKSKTKKAPAKTVKKKKAAAKKAPAKKATKKKAAAKKAPAKKPAKKKTAKKKVPAKKASPKKAARKKAPAKKRARKKAAPDKTRMLLDLALKVLDDAQADDVSVIDLAGKSAMADFMVVASGRNPRHIGAMAQNLREKIKGAGLGVPGLEGLGNADWVLIDGGDVIVHLFRPEVRGLYNLEKMWSTEFRDVENEYGLDRPGRG